MLNTLTIVLALIGVAATALVFIAVQGTRVQAMISRRRERRPRAE